MMAYEKSERAQNNFGKFIRKFQPETETLIRNFESILIKLYRQNVLKIYISKVGAIHGGWPESSLVNS